MKNIFKVMSLLVLALVLCTFSVAAALEDINEDTCTVIKEEVKRGTPIVDGELDAIYSNSMTLSIHGPASSYYISGGSCDDTTATGMVYALHDDNYVYVFFKVVDETLIQADPEYVEISAHPHLTDSVEVRIGDDLEDHFAPYNGSNDAHHLIYADAHGTRVSSYDESLGRDEVKLKGESVIWDDGKTYCVELAIPLRKPFEEGEIIEFEFQINDLQDDMDSMCAVGSGYPHHLVMFRAGGDAVTKLSAEDESTIAGGIVEIPIRISGNPGLAGLGFVVGYPDDFTLISAIRGDALSSMDVTFSKDIATKPYTILFDGLDADDSEGTVVILKFKVDENAQPANYEVAIEPIIAYDNATVDVEIEGDYLIVAVKDYLPGDINGDEVVDLKDVTALRRYHAGGYNVAVQEAALDVNRDGMTDLKDVTVLRRYLAGGYGVELN